MKPWKVFLLAGEDSGDLHGANLVKALKDCVRQQLMNFAVSEVGETGFKWKTFPPLSYYLQVRGVGGDKLSEVGVELIAHVKDINFMGFWEVLKNLRTIRQLFHRVHAEIEDFQPDAVILIDYPGFNLRLAKQLQGKGIKIFYYISPQVWAWKKGRVKSIEKYVDRMYVILPFEQSFYAKEGVEVEFVGHPLLDVVESKEKSPPSEKIIALLPGSRKQEIGRMLPIMLQMVPLFPDYRFVVAGAPSQEASFYHSLIGDISVELRMNQTYELLSQASYACVTSGTATLETALFNVPQVVVYKGNPISYTIGKRLVNVEFISLVNLILGRKAVEELIQRAFTAEKLEQTLKNLMEEKNSQKMLTDYEELRKKLGDGGASARTAGLIFSELSKSEEISVNSESEN